MKRVLVTGATGFVGRQILPLLESRGYEVHAVTSRQVIPCDTMLKWHRADLLANDVGAELVQQVRPTHLLHLAWYTAHRKYWTALENLQWVSSSLALTEAFLKCGGERAVFAGTCAEYDWRYGYCSELLTPLVPATLYGSCKTALANIVQALSRQVGSSLSWARLFHIYGPYERPERVVASTIQALLLDQPALCTSGDQVRDFLHVADVAGALVTLLDSSYDGPINLASGQPVALADLLRRIADLLNRRHLLQLGAVQAGLNEPPVLIADVRPLLNDLGWRPSLSLEDGLTQTIAWWRSQIGTRQG